jgi:hypothetical protein
MHFVETHGSASPDDLVILVEEKKEKKERRTAVRLYLRMRGYKKSFLIKRKAKKWQQKTLMLSKMYIAEWQIA